MLQNHCEEKIEWSRSIHLNLLKNYHLFNFPSLFITNNFISILLREDNQWWKTNKKKTKKKINGIKTFYSTTMIRIFWENNAKRGLSKKFWFFFFEAILFFAIRFYETMWNYGNILLAIIIIFYYYFILFFGLASNRSTLASREQWTGDIYYRYSILYRLFWSIIIVDYEKKNKTAILFFVRLLNLFWFR